MFELQGYFTFTYYLFSGGTGTAAALADTATVRLTLLLFSHPP